MKAGMSRDDRVMWASASASKLGEYMGDKDKMAGYAGWGEQRNGKHQ